MMAICWDLPSLIPGIWIFLGIPGPRLESQYHIPTARVSQQLTGRQGMAPLSCTVVTIIPTRGDWTSGHGPGGILPPVASPPRLCLRTLEFTVELMTVSGCLQEVTTVLGCQRTLFIVSTLAATHGTRLQQPLLRYEKATLPYTTRGETKWWFLAASNIREHG